MGGGGCLLALVLIGSRKERCCGSTSTGLLFRSFGGLAALSVAVLALSGLYSAGVDVATPDALITTLYGQALLAKTLLFMVVGVIGLTNSLLVRSGADRARWLGRGVRLEAALVTGVILLAALLTATAPARGERFAAPRKMAPEPAPVRSAPAGDLLVSLSVKPNEPGANFVTAGVFDTRRPAPAQVRGVDVSIGGAAGRWHGQSRHETATGSSRRASSTAMARGRSPSGSTAGGCPIGS